MLSRVLRFAVAAICLLTIMPAYADARPMNWASSCQRTIRQRIGRPVVFISTRSQSASPALYMIAGSARTRLRAAPGRPAAWRTFNYQCRVNRINGAVVSSSFSWVGGPVYYPGTGTWVPYPYPLPGDRLPEGPER
jgi:hypothetical protein